MRPPCTPGARAGVRVVWTALCGGLNALKTQEPLSSAAVPLGSSLYAQAYSWCSTAAHASSAAAPPAHVASICGCAQRARSVESVTPEPEPELEP